MTLNRIKRLRNCRVFRNYRWPNDLTPFAKLNLIYGWNGSGKTTISRLLRDLELRRSMTSGEVTLQIDGQDLSGTDFSDTSVPIRVFNRDFVSENVLPTQGGDFSPILILGQQSIEDQTWLNAFRFAFASVETSLRERTSRHQAFERALDRHCITSAKLVRELLRGPGDNPYNNYDKANYNTAAQEMEQEPDFSYHVLDHGAKDSLLSQYRSSQETEIDDIEFEAIDYKLLREKVQKLASTPLTSEFIETLKDNSVLSHWVRSGLDLHMKENSDKCLFCEQVLPPNRISVLEQHFNAQYQDLMNSIEELSEEIVTLTKSITDLMSELPNRAQIYDHIVEKFDKSLTDCNQYQDQSKAYLDLLTKVLSCKRDRPFASISEDTIPIEFPDASAIVQLKEAIKSHNLMCQQHAAKAVEAGKKLANGIIVECLDEFNELTLKVKTSKAAVTFANSQKLEIEDEIARIEAEIIEHRRPAEEFNDDLAKYVGHNELYLEVEKNGYMLSRNGVPASQLSEGEITAIGLLYFLKTLTDHRFDFTNGIVMLDDPVSSLDANSLFLAFGFIQERTRDAGQLFVLTHNFTFFRQVRNWFHHAKGQRSPKVERRPARFYMLNCQSDEEGRYSGIQALDPLLEQYESDYQYLFSCVVRSVNCPNTSLEFNYLLPNIARRLLEAFLAFRQPDVRGSLWNKMQNVNFDPAKKTQILRFVHTYSHNDAVVEPDHDLFLLGETNTVLSALLELIEEEDPRHFKGMMKLLNAENEEEDEDAQ